MGTSGPQFRGGSGDSEYVNPGPYVYDVVVAKSLSLTPGYINNPWFRNLAKYGYLVDFAARLAMPSH
jgi:hypothetical protein